MKGGLRMNNRHRLLRNTFIGVAGCIVLFWLLFKPDKVGVAWNFLKGLFSPFVIGAGVAFILNVPMRAIEGKLQKINKPGLRRGIAVLLTFLAVILVVFLVVQLLIPQLIATIQTLIDKLPGFASRMWDHFNNFLHANPAIMEWAENNTEFEPTNWMSYVEQFLTWTSDSMSGFVSGAFTAIGSVFTGVFNGIIAFAFSLYCLFRKEILAGQVRRLLYAFLPEKFCDETVRIARLTSTTFANFISGQCLEALVLGMMFAVAMLIFQFPYVPLISVLVAICALVPIVGAFVGCGLSTFFILVDDPVKAFWFMLMFLIIQQFEGNVIYPKVVGSSVGLPGMWVLLAVALGGKLMGVAGMFIMIPVASVVYTLLREKTNKRLEMRKIDADKLMPHPTERRTRPQSEKKPKEKRRKKSK